MSFLIISVKFSRQKGKPFSVISIKIVTKQNPDINWYWIIEKPQFTPIMPKKTHLVTSLFYKLSYELTATKI